MMQHSTLPSNTCIISNACPPLFIFSLFFLSTMGVVPLLSVVMSLIESPLGEEFG